MNFSDLDDIYKILSELEDRIRDIADIIHFQKNKIIEVINFCTTKKYSESTPTSINESDSDISNQINSLTHSDSDDFNDTFLENEADKPIIFCEGKKRTSGKRWMEIISTGLKNKSLILEKLFTKLVELQLMEYKDEDDKIIKKGRLYKTLRRFKDKKIVDQESNDHNAPWIWLGEPED